ncbi:MAG TPA: hypothetical protein VFY91_15310 [Microbacterium sp.]|nr:hypothetical protein [Microbacterium sp.]
MMRWVPVLVLVALLTGCASAGSPAPTGAVETPPPTPSSEGPAATVPRFVGPADDGMTYVMAVGQTTALRTGAREAAEPVAEGRAVLLVEVVNVTDSGTREWEVRAVRPGASVIRGGVGETAWEIALRVED